MAYLARIEPEFSQPFDFRERIAPPAAAPEFSELEWSIVRLARRDGLSTLRPYGRVRRFFRWLTGLGINPTLADPRLEAIRRISVLSWRFGFSVPANDVADFFAAGFSPDQYELLVSSVRAAVASSTKRNAR
jgi:hypothetical protein